MVLEQFKDIEEALAFLGDEGYRHTFTCCPQGWQCKETKAIYTPNQMKVEACHRFKKCGGAHKVAVLYAVSAPDGTKGVIIDNFSTYDNPLFGEFLVRMKLHQMPQSGRP